MRIGIIVFPGTNCARDVARGFKGCQTLMIWHRDSGLPEVDRIVIPGGFSYGDYLRPGAIASRSPILREVKKKALDGTPTLGICNGFQILTEIGLLPGSLLLNQTRQFICRTVTLRVENVQTLFTSGYAASSPVIRLPIAHKYGRYDADQETLRRLEGENQIIFRYEDNPNGSVNHIAGIAVGAVCGIMPHPERGCEPAHGLVDGALFFSGFSSAGLEADSFSDSPSAKQSYSL